MPVYKEYSTEQYIAFLKHPFAYNFGMSKEKTIDWYVQKCADSIRSDYHVTHETMKNTYLPTVEKMLGGYFMFFAISVQEGGGAGNWINHWGVDTGSTPLECLEDDCNYVLQQCSTQQDYVCLSAHEVLGGAQAVEDHPGAIMKAYSQMKVGSLGRYYMTATLAGNSWVWCTNWSLANQGPVPGVYYGNPYDAIIDVVKSAGADPFGSGGTNAGSSPTPGDAPKPKDPAKKTVHKARTITPGRIYLNNATPIKLTDNLKFTRFKNFLTLNYVYDADNPNNQREEVANNTQVDQSDDKSNNNDKVKKFLKRLKSIYSKQFVYSNNRPAPNLSLNNYTDCSGFVGWVIQDVYPTIWANGYVNTGTIYAGMMAGGSKRVFFTSDGRPAFRTFLPKLQTGDIVLMGDQSNFGAGNSMHVGIMYGNGANAPFANQNGTDTNWTQSITQTLNGYDYVGLYQPYWAVMRVN